MRKITFLLGFIAILTASCYNEQIEDEAIKASQRISDYRTLEEALEIAQHATSMLDGCDNNTRGFFGRTIDVNEVRAIRNSAITRTDGKLDTIMYVVNFKDSLGFAIISADRALPGLIAITEDGYYNPNEEQENKSFTYIMEKAKLYINRDSLPFTPGIEDEPINEVIEQAGPYVSVKWGQRYTYGKYCPNGYSGCGPTAAVQAMTYFQPISSITLSYPNHDMSTQSLDWADMKQHILYMRQIIGQPSLYCTASDSAHNAIGRLCRQVGHLMNANYSSSSGTGVSAPNLRSAISQLGISYSGYHYYYSGNSESLLENGHILLQVGIALTEDNDTIGHAWILDGFKKIKTTHPGILDINGNPIIEYNNYNHINWGWDGRCNGYFLDGVFNTTQRYSTDPSPYASTADWNFFDVVYLDLFTF